MLPPSLPPSPFPPPPPLRVRRSFRSPCFKLWFCFSSTHLTNSHLHTSEKSPALVKTHSVLSTGYHRLSMVSTGYHRLSMVEHICIFIVTVVLRSSLIHVSTYTLYVYVHVHVYAKYLYMYNVLCGVSLPNCEYVYAYSLSLECIHCLNQHSLFPDDDELRRTLQSLALGKQGTGGRVLIKTPKVHVYTCKHMYMYIQTHVHVHVYMYSINTWYGQSTSKLLKMYYTKPMYETAKDVSH